MSWTTDRARIAALSRSRTPDDPDLIQARRALGLARTVERVRQAIEDAPPLDAETAARLRSLIPAAVVQAGDLGGDAA